MSARLVRLVLDRFRGTSSEKLVLVAIADHANAEGIAWPTQRRLAKEAGISTRQVERIVPELTRRGWLKVEERRGCRSNRYRVVEPIDTDADGGIRESQETGIPTPTSDEHRHPRRDTDLYIIDSTNRTVIEPPIGASAPDSPKPRTAKKIGAKRRAEVPFPNDLSLTPDMARFATGLGIDPTTEFAAWRDNCLAHDRRYVDWPAAWRYRCRMAVKFAAQRNGSVPQPVASAPRPRIRTLDEALAGDRP